MSDKIDNMEELVPEDIDLVKEALRESGEQLSEIKNRKALPYLQEVKDEVPIAEKVDEVVPDSTQLDDMLRNATDEELKEM